MVSEKNIQFLKKHINKQQTIELIETFGGNDAYNKGWFADLTALNTAYATGEDGWFAILGSTDSIWTWDSDTDAWVNTAGGGSSYSIGNEALIGTKNGSNKIFTISHTPIENSLNVYLNGQFLVEDVGYALSGSTITLTDAPASDEDLWATYNYL